MACLTPHRHRALRLAAGAAAVDVAAAERAAATAAPAAVEEIAVDPMARRCSRVGAEEVASHCLVAAAFDQAAEAAADRAFPGPSRNFRRRRQSRAGQAE
jgi:hypothetical protein